MQSDSDSENSEELDYGNEDSDDSDSDHEEAKPWAGNKKTTTTTSFSTSRRKSQISDDEDDESVQGGENQDYRSPGFVEAEYEDYVKLTFPRRRLARICNEPYFERAVKKFYVKIGVGYDKNTRQPTYRLCQIVGVEAGESDYSFPKTRNEKAVSLVCVSFWFLYNILFIFQLIMHPLFFNHQ